VNWAEERRRTAASAAEQKRQDAVAAAEQTRQDALVAAQIEQVRARTKVETRQAHTAQRAELERQRRADQEARRDQVRARRTTRLAGLRAWAGAHVVDLMIYPLAVVSAVMAIPAMAAFGFHVYGTAAGSALPVITELGMWAFAFAVQLVRYRSARDGQDRPVWALQTGVWSFAAVAAGLNFVHGLTAAPSDVVGQALAGAVSVPPFAAGLVMAVASVAGVMAHQLVTAAPRRGRADRDAARVARRAAVKVARVRMAAVRSAVAQIDGQGGVGLVFTPGHYQLTRARLAPWRWGQGKGLKLAALPGLPVTAAIEEEWDDLERELAVLIATTDPHPGPAAGPSLPPVGGGIGTLDRDPRDTGHQPGSASIDPTGDPADRPRPARKSTPKSAPRLTSTSASGSTRKAGRGSGRLARSIEDLRAELDRLIEADPTAVDLASAESIRRALHCSPKRARELRDDYPHGDGGEAGR
jgi:hypothetical protein